MSDFSKYNTASNEIVNPAPVRTRGEILNLCDDNFYHIDFVGFDTGKFGEYVYFHIIEDVLHTYYGGKRVTAALRAIANDNLVGEVSSHACKFTLNEFTTKDGKPGKYVDIEFKS